MAGITLRGVAKRYGETRALEETDLEIADHEFLVLVGPSGSGKTTLLRAIAGLETVTEGDIYFGDRRVTDVDVSDRDIAMVFQNYGLYPHMTVYANMAFGLRRRKIPRPEIAAKVRQTATLLGIETLLERKPRQLSGGQRQRVALGRAIVRDPAVFLLDEPLSNLDAHLRAAMRAEILKVHRAVTATAVYVTHDQVEAMTMGDRIAVMQGGLIQQLGTPADLYDHPASQFVAGFIGTPAMGFLTCHRADHADHADHADQAEGAGTAGEAGAGPADGTAWHAPGVRLQLTPEQTAALPEGTTRLVAGIRPEHLQPVSAAGRDQATCLIEGTVDVVEPLGADQHILVSTGDTTITVRRPREDHITRDQKIALTTDPARLHLFDTDTGRAYRQ